PTGLLFICSLSTTPHPPTSSLFPYTTLFRSVTVATGRAPADSASCVSSCRSSGSTCAPSPRRTSTARSPVRGRSNTQAFQDAGIFMGCAQSLRGLAARGCCWPLRAASRRVYRSLGGRLRRGTAFLGGQAHVARGHHGGNRVLVDHLADAVPQQHDKLVERVDLTLQLDAVD